MNDRQARDLPLDAHLHTNLSPDSEVPIDTFASQAVERGIGEIAITDHLDFEPGAPAYRYVSFDERERTVREAAERWGERGLAIRFGAEITWDSRWADDIRDHLRHHEYDFTIGSAHVYRGSPYEASNVASWVAGRSLPEIIEPYFSEVERAIRSGLFDAIGHLDVVKRYLAPHVTAADLAAAPELYEPLLRALVESGTALEINTSGLRQEAREIYPPAHIVERFRELGGERITIGSDAHRADTFAWALDDGYRVATDAGFDALSFRRGDGRVVVPMATTPNAVAGRSL
ncbi:MAG: histidinol-phosphatase HisJ family protein [Chloroflexota bacterium]